VTNRIKRPREQELLAKKEVSNDAQTVRSGGGKTRKKKEVIAPTGHYWTPGGGGEQTNLLLLGGPTGSFFMKKPIGEGKYPFRKRNCSSVVGRPRGGCGRDFQ